MTELSLADRIHDEEDFPADHPTLMTCAVCLRRIPDDEDRLIVFLGAGDGSYIRITRVYMDCSSG